MKNVARLLFAALALPAFAQTTVLSNLAYKTGTDLSDYERERCVLDLYLPTNRPFPTIVWFHGGGLTAGTKDGSTRAIARALASEGVAIAAANYRLSPHVKFPAYVEDSAAAVAWTRASIAAHGGDSNAIFAGGHSAGGYLVSMLAMNPEFLAKHGLDRSAMAGIIPVSGQVMTHFTVRHERGFTSNNITADDAAPIYHTRPDTPPQLIFMGDKDWPARLEENQYFVAMQRVAGNTNITFHLIPNRNHGTIASGITKPNDPVRTNILHFIRTHTGK